MKWNPYSQYDVTNLQYKPGMGDVSLTWTIILFIAVIGLATGLYFWKKHKDSEYEYKVEEIPSKSVEIINKAIEEI